MFDPVTNVEIEDVLSSIRRLVSEDSRPRFDLQALEKHDETQEEARETELAEALVLTPALRVAEFVEPAEARKEIAGDQAEFQAETEDGGDDSSSGEGAGKTVDQPQDWSQDDSHDDSMDEAEPDVYGTEQDRDETQAAIEAAVEDEKTDADISSEDGESEETYNHLSLETRIAEVEDAVADQDDQWEPDGEEEGDNTAAPVEALQWEDHVDPASDDQTEDFGEDQHQDQENWQDQADEERDETHVEDVLPQDTEAADPVSEDIDEAGDVQTEAAADDAPEIAARKGADNQETDVDLFGADDAILDEDMLREMVSEIVRQELQGALGERITRNVRKLVRREIHRALASQELD
jgi:hypothetical protein